MSDALDDLARRLFDAARDEQPDAQLIARVHAQTDAAPALPALERNDAEQSGPRRLPAPPKAHPLRWLALAALLGGSLLWVLVRSASPDGVNISAEAPTERPSPPASAAREPEPQLDERAAAGAPRGQPALTEPAVAPKEQEPLPHNPAPRTRPPHGTPTAPAVPAAPPAATAVATPAPAAAPAARASLSTQLELLKQARSLLRSGDAAGALAAVDRYGNELHGTDLQDEADVLRIEALSALGRKPEATALARRYIAAHPDSPLAERAQRFLDDAPAAGSRSAPTSAP